MGIPFIFIDLAKMHFVFYHGILLGQANILAVSAVKKISVHIHTCSIIMTTQCGQNHDQQSRSPKTMHAVIGQTRNSLNSKIKDERKFDSTIMQNI